MKLQNSNFNRPGSAAGFEAWNLIIPWILKFDL
jgi:hypothetical protein